MSGGLIRPTMGSNHNYTHYMLSLGQSPTILRLPIRVVRIG